MPAGQQYATNVPQTNLTGLINATATVMSVGSSSGWPATPFTAILEIGTSLQEPIDVTNITGTTWTVVRAIDSTVGFTHQVGATVTHGDIGRDFREARSHIDASTGVHGIGGGSSVVGTTDVQNLSNKTIVSGSYSGAQNMGSGAWTGTGTLQEAALAFSGLTGATAQTTRFVGTVNTGAAPASGTFALGDMVYDTVYKTLWVCTAAGSPGTWIPMGGGSNTGLTAAGTITVPSWANTIRLAWSCRSNNAVSGGVFLLCQINGDTGSHYTWQDLTGSGGTAAAQNAGGLGTGIIIGLIPGNSDSANYYGTGELVVTDCQTAVFKAVASHYNSPFSTSTANAGVAGGLWESTAAITSIKILPLTGTLTANSNMDVEFLT